VGGGGGVGDGGVEVGCLEEGSGWGEKEVE